MDYNRIYNELIENARTRGAITGYSEGHHVIMRKMGGSDDPDNIVRLSAREHYMAHWLLHKIHRSRETGAAWAAMTSNKNGLRYTSATWALAREAGVEAHRGAKRSAETCRKISEAAMGRKASLESRAKMSASRTGVGNSFYGKSHTEETKDKIRESKLGKSGKAVVATCMNTGDIHRFPSAHYAAKEDVRDIGKDSSSISKACRGKIKSHNGYLWNYADQE